MAQGNILAAELFIEDAKASAKLSAFLNTLELTDQQIKRVGRDGEFGKGIASQLDIIDGRARKTSSLLSGAFSAENIVKGAAFGAVIRFLDNSIDKSLAAEKANRLLASSATEAGKSYAVLAEQNERFAKAAALGETSAAGTLAKIQQLSTFSGGKTSTEDLAKSFLDLGAAKGIDNKDLETLIGSILSGQDEGLNRFGIADPGKLYEAFADKVGKTTEELSQFEKVQASVNAVQETAAIFTGANADKLASLSGQLETGRANWENLQTDLGNAITGSTQFRNAVSFLTQTMEGLSLSVVKVQKLLAEGVAPKDIAEKQADTAFNKAITYFEDKSGMILGRLLYEYDVLTVGVEDANRRFLESSTGARKRMVDQLTGEVEAEAKKELTRDKAAEDQKKAIHARDLALDKKHAEEKAASLRENSIERLIKTDAPFREFQKALEGFRPETEDDQKLFDKVADYIENSVKKAKDKTKELEKSATEAFDSIIDRYGAVSENPIVKVFDTAREASDKLKLAIAGLTPEMQSSLTELADRLNDLELIKSRLDNSLNAQSLRDDAYNFRNPISEEKNKEQENRFKREFLAANPNYLFLQEQEFAQRQLTGYNQGETFEQFTNKDLEKRAGLGIETSAERRQAEIDRKIKIINESRSSGDAQLGAIADRKLISISQGVDPNSLSDRQREDFAAAREREAVRVEQNEEKAREVEKKKVDALSDIRTDLGRLVTVAENEGLGGIVRIIDESKGAARVESKRPTAVDTARQYQQGLRLSGGNRLSNR